MPTSNGPLQGKVKAWCYHLCQLGAQLASCSRGLCVHDSCRPSISVHAAALMVSMFSSAQGRLSGIKEAMLPALAETVIGLSGGCDPAVAKNSQRIIAELLREEEKFASTLEAGVTSWLLIQGMYFAFLCYDQHQKFIGGLRSQRQIGKLAGVIDIDWCFIRREEAESGVGSCCGARLSRNRQWCSCI